MQQSCLRPSGPEPVFGEQDVLNRERKNMGRTIQERQEIARQLADQTAEYEEQLQKARADAIARPLLEQQKKIGTQLKAAELREARKALVFDPSPEWDAPKYIPCNDTPAQIQAKIIQQAFSPSF